MNVAVTGVGGGVGQSIIKSLQHTEYNVVGIDGEFLGTGLYATNRAYLGHYASNPQYIDKLIEICQKDDCTVLFPGLDAELIPLSRSIRELSANGIIPVVSRPEIIGISDDKVETSNFLKRNGFPYIKTIPIPDYGSQFEYPIFIKPRRGGARSVGTFLAKNENEFNQFCSNIYKPDFVVQEYIPGEEYTCGSVSFDKGCVGTIVMRRQLRDGDTYKAFVVLNETFSDFVKSVINELKPFGACNLQFKIKDGDYYIFDINARCSGTTASRALAGFNEPKMICDYIFKGIDNPPIEIKKVAILRYWKELLVDCEKINELRSNSSISNKHVLL